MRPSLHHRPCRRLLTSLQAMALAALLAGTALSSWAGAGKPEAVVRMVAPNTGGLQFVLSHPLWLGSRTGNTPYQRLQICIPRQRCKTMFDGRGDNTALMLNPDSDISPDGQFLIYQTIHHLDRKNRQYAREDYHFISIDGDEVIFKTAKGHIARTDNTLGWLPGQPHALRIRVDAKGGSEAALPGYAK